MGRPRKAGKREKNGRIKRASVNTGEAPNAMAAREVVALQRLNRLGWDDTAVNRVKVMDPMYGTEHGILLKAKAITRDQYDAAELMQQREARYRAVVGFSDPNASASNIFSVGGGAGDPFDVDERQIEIIKSQRADVMRCLHEERAYAACIAVVLRHTPPHDQSTVDALVRGLQRVFVDIVAGERRRSGVVESAA